MKRLKKLIGIVLAMTMILAMAASVSAANVEIKGDTGALISGHTFMAYQIFTGTQASSEDKNLADVEWGSGIKEQSFLSALKSSDALGTPNPFAEAQTAAEVAAALGVVSDTVAKTVARIANDNINAEDGISLIVGSENNLDTGYYLIVDTTNISGDAVKNASLLQVVGDSVTINVKTDKPSVEKKVQENTDTNDAASDGKYGDNYNDTADYNIGDDVPFAFYSAVPDMTYYGSYKFILHDTMSGGLTLNTDSIKVTIGDIEINASEDTYSIVTDDLKDNCTFEIVFDDLNAISDINTGDAIKVEFTAKLNTSAVIGLPGNTNEVYLEYSNNPNEEGTGKTPEDIVIVFTYELDTTKIDGADAKTKLQGAEFQLYRMNGEEKEYVIVNNGGKVTGWVTDESQASTLTSGADGLFKVIGLDDGNYYLKETKAPAGYNLLTSDIEIKVQATVVHSQNWSGTPNQALNALRINVKQDGKSASASGNADSGIVSASIANNKGGILPETGGIGTTIFYIVGAVLMIGAALILITRKRVSK